VSIEDGGRPGIEDRSRHGLLERIVPDRVVAIETRQELLETELFAQELAIVENAVEKRRNEFVTARACAHAALEGLGVPAQPILNGERGEPLWPAGVVGSITHCKDYRACVVAHESAVATLGIDAELSAPLPDGVLEAIAHPQELEWVGKLQSSDPDTHWDRLLFSAKESVYKAWFPLARRWLGFEDALVTVSPDGSFSAKLLVEGPRLAAGPLEGFSGRWIAAEGLILTAIALLDPSGLQAR
jgi:4'-phosphopantetheinyl transferase EntD